MQIQLCCFQGFVVVVPALAFAPFGIAAIAFWIYVCARLFIIGLVVALNYLFDTLLFCGATLLLANAMDKEAAVART